MYKTWANTKEKMSQVTLWKCNRFYLDRNSRIIYKHVVIFPASCSTELDVHAADGFKHSLNHSFSTHGSVWRPREGISLLRLSQKPHPLWRPGNQNVGLKEGGACFRRSMNWGPESDKEGLLWAVSRTKLLWSTNDKLEQTWSTLKQRSSLQMRLVLKETECLPCNYLLCFCSSRVSGVGSNTLTSTCPQGTARCSQMGDTFLPFFLFAFPQLAAAQHHVLCSFIFSWSSFRLVSFPLTLLHCLVASGGETGGWWATCHICSVTYEANKASFSLCFLSFLRLTQGGFTDVCTALLKCCTGQPLSGPVTRSRRSNRQENVSSNDCRPTNKYVHIVQMTPESSGWRPPKTPYENGVAASPASARCSCSLFMLNTRGLKLKLFLLLWWMNCGHFLSSFRFSLGSCFGLFRWINLAIPFSHVS